MKTECSIVKDLLPLYAEDMVSRETAQYVSDHLKECPECRAELAELRENAALTAIESESIPNTDAAKPFKKIMKRMNRQFHMLAYSLIIFFIFLGFAWTAGENLMYNSLIMPIVGIFGYYVFKWKAVYKVPVLLLLIDLAVFAFQLVEIGFADTIGWTFIYSIFVLIGVAIAFLLHYALRKENEK